MRSFKRRQGKSGKANKVNAGVPRRRIIGRETEDEIRSGARIYKEVPSGPT
jgi:hypothetical protein